MLKKLVFAFLYILIFPALLFLLAGDWGWSEGWVFAIWFLVLCYTTIMYLYRKDPGGWIQIGSHITPLPQGGSWGER